MKSKLDMEDDELGVEAMSHFCSPQRSFREKITDFFTAYDDANAEREGSVSPPMPILTPQVSLFNLHHFLLLTVASESGGQPPWDGRLFGPRRTLHSASTYDP